MGRPQKSVVYAANATALGDMAQPLRDAADKMLESTDRVRNTVYDFEWEGDANDAAEGRVDRELVQNRAVGSAEHDLADAYENGAKTMQPMIDRLTSKGQGLEADDFAVSEDWVVTDTYDYDTARKLAGLLGLSTSDVDALQTQRGNEAATETVNLQRLADELGVADDNTTKAINDAKAALADATGQPHIVLVDDTQHQPSIDGRAGDPVEEQQQGSPYDLGATIAGTGIVVTGDPETGKPRLVIPGTEWNGDNPFPVEPGYRALPTGTAVGPDGQEYAFYSVKPYGPGTTPDNYIGPDSHVQNLADPTKDLGPLHGTVPGSSVPVGISQASGVYDPKTNRMVIVGNVGQDGQRALWQSDPIRPGDSPNAWMNSMHQVGAFDNLGAADRENQIVGLPQGGYLLTSASNGGQVVGVTATGPEGLLNASSQAITGPGLIPSPGNQPAFPYGPTIVNVDTLPNGQEQVTMRVSTWPTPQGWPTGPDTPPAPYHPHTYTTTFNINP